MRFGSGPGRFGQMAESFVGLECGRGSPSLWHSVLPGTPTAAAWALMGRTPVLGLALLAQPPPPPGHVWGPGVVYPPLQRRGHSSELGLGSRCFQGLRAFPRIVTAFPQRLSAAVHTSTYNTPPDCGGLQRLAAFGGPVLYPPAPAPAGSRCRLAINRRR